MVFENILDYKIAEKKLFLVFIYAIALTSISIFVAYYIFPQNASVVFLFLITLSASHIVYNELRQDEEEDEKDPFIDRAFWNRNEKIIKVYGALFLGCIVAVSFWHTILPQNQVNAIFGSQIQTIQNMQNIDQNNGMGNAIANKNILFDIVKNNIIVMALAFLFSFVFGSGALYIIFWNASVIGVFISKSAAQIGIIGMPGIAHTLVFSSICFHGIPEALAYFVAGISGGILSIGIIGGHNREIIIKDAFVLFAASIILIIIAGFIEVVI